VVVFSNGPDNASMVAPGDVGRLAENEGIPVYIVSTLDSAREPRLAAALQSLCERSGGKFLQAPKWQDQAAAFEAVRRDIASSYTAYYYPAAEVEPGYRRIEVKAAAPGGSKWQIRSRAGYDARSGPASR
jgi:hypothetical protein